MTGHDLYDEVHRVLAAVGHRQGIPVHDAVLLRMHSNAAFALASAGLLVRIATNPAARARVASSVQLTRWLADRGFPCVVPADVEQPLVEHDRVVSLWHLLDAAPEPAPTGADLGRILRALHDLPAPPHAPHRFRDPLASTASALTETPDVLSGPDRRWLHDRIARLRRRWRSVEFGRPAGLIHGDAHLNNLIRTADGRVVLGDWDHVAVGPREWDLVQVHYTRRRFGRPADDDVAAFTAAYGWDVRDWSGFDTLLATREISGLSPYIRTAHVKEFSRRELALRVENLRARDATARWTAPSSEPAPAT